MDFETGDALRVSGIGCGLLNMAAAAPAGQPLRVSVAAPAGVSVVLIEDPADAAATLTPHSPALRGAIQWATAAPGRVATVRGVPII
jgi:hypothetical protein